MKKILILVLIILLLVLTYFAIWRGIKPIKINSIKDIKNQSKILDANVTKATNLATVKYPEGQKELEDAIKELKLAKQEYENKNPYNAEQVGIGILEVKTYKIHYLWTILGNYRKEEGVRSINLDLKSTDVKDVYDLQFTLVGNYVSITDFLYDIEDDEELQFEVKNLSIKRTSEKVATTNATAESNSNANSVFGNAANANTNTANTNTANTNTANINTTKASSTNTSSKTTNDRDYSEGGTILEATFTVQSIGITLD